MATRAVEVNDAVPALSAERQVTWPNRMRARLSNGLEVILVESHTIPKFHGDLYFRSGNVATIERGPGLAEMTATVARTGTTKRASRQIEEDLRRIGADLATSAGSNQDSLQASGCVKFCSALILTLKFRRAKSRLRRTSATICLRFTATFTRQRTVCFCLSAIFSRTRC